MLSFHFSSVLRLAKGADGSRRVWHSYHHGHSYTESSCTRTFCVLTRKPTPEGRTWTNQRWHQPLMGQLCRPDQTVTSWNLSSTSPDLSDESHRREQACKDCIINIREKLLNAAEKTLRLKRCWYSLVQFMLICTCIIHVDMHISIDLTLIYVAKILSM